MEIEVSQEKLSKALGVVSRVALVALVWCFVFNFVRAM